MLVLVVEDDEDYAEIVAELLRRDSLEPVIAGNAKSALRFAEHHTPDLVVMDVMLPDSTGYEICQQLRAKQPSLPVLFLSSLDRPTDIVAGFNSGGDDYLTKPFHPAEFISRIRALARRSNPSLPIAATSLATKITGEGFELDSSNQSAYLNGINLNCTRLEFEIVQLLAGYPGQVLSYSYLSEQIWNYTNVEDGTLLKGHISSVRRKLKEAGGNEDLIRTVHGVGYSFTPV